MDDVLWLFVSGLVRYHPLVQTLRPQTEGLEFGVDELGKRRPVTLNCQKGQYFNKIVLKYKKKLGYHGLTSLALRISLKLQGSFPIRHGYCNRQERRKL